MFWAGWGYPESGFRWRFLSKFMLSLLRMTGLKGLLTGGFRCPRRGGGELTHFDIDPRVRGGFGVRVAVVTGLGESVWGIDLTGDRPQNPTSG